MLHDTNALSYYSTSISCSRVFLLPTLQQVSTHRWHCSELINYCSLFALTEGNKKENINTIMVIVLSINDMNFFCIALLTTVLQEI